MDQRLFKIKDRDKLVAFIFLTYRDGTVTLPYVYFASEYIEEISKIILHQILLFKAETFACFHKELTKIMEERSKPFFHVKTITKTIGIPKSLRKYYDQTPIIQDGDGDVVFT